MPFEKKFELSDVKGKLSTINEIYMKKNQDLTMLSWVGQQFRPQSEISKKGIAFLQKVSEIFESINYGNCHLASATFIAAMSFQQYLISRSYKEDFHFFYKGGSAYAHSKLYKAINDISGIDSELTENDIKNVNDGIDFLLEKASMFKDILSTEELKAFQSDINNMNLAQENQLYQEASLSLS